MLKDITILKSEHKISRILINKEKKRKNIKCACEFWKCTVLYIFNSLMNLFHYLLSVLDLLKV